MKKYMVVLVVTMLVLGISVTAYGYGMKGYFQGGMFGPKSGERLENLLQKQATILGITINELKKQLESGKTFLDLAKEKGINVKPMMNKMFRNEGMLTRYASILGITVEELKKELESGKTFLDIVKAKGITEEQLKAKMLELQKERLQELVKAGKITQEQADQKLEAMKQRQEQAPCPTCGQGFGFPGGFKGKFNRPNP